jgi:hypothetical protein
LCGKFSVRRRIFVRRISTCGSKVSNSSLGRAMGGAL